MAARVLGESARAIGLDPATMGQPTNADRTRTDEREVAEPRLPVGAWKSRGEAPFDLAEQAGSRYDLERSAAQPKVGRATTEADAKPIAEDTSRSGAPFDIEREGSIARAA